MRILSIISMLLFATLLKAQDLKPLPPVPTKYQQQWQEMEFYIFVHFGPNTFTDKEWGAGNEPEDAFNPTQMDCKQWVRIAKAAGAKGIIITAKHHDGFCLWPSKYSNHTVKQSKWRNGKGDVLKDLSRACKEAGLKFGVYISPWDRNHPAYGTPAYNDVYINTMKEIFSKYGPIWELWWDGANGEGPNGKKMVYDFHRFEETIRKISPATVIFSDIGPDIRWIGNEKGIAGETNWNLLDTAGFKRGNGAPETDTLNSGNVNGKNWIPGEADVSIRPGWFYHKEEDQKVKTPEQLFDLYLKSVGRGTNLLLNVPPDRRGLMTSYDSAALMGFKKLREDNFKYNLIKNESVQIVDNKNQRITFHLSDENSSTFDSLPSSNHSSVYIKCKEKKKINCVVLQEPIAMGQRISEFKVLLLNDKDEPIREISGTTIGRKRILTFDQTEISGMSIRIDQSKDLPLLSEIAAYNILLSPVTK
ncbi:MAG: glycoside hydrolase family 29 (alpha-L-fucosidase) [Bacteroidetes bacterium]|nr:MAG: glycoside hydrolase family 29 (alpha-L-fucosidase) [Bacteroidota bacterium]